MRTLVYKRAHSGDPDSQGQFGIADCMGSVRARDFDAVIGVGGQGAEAERSGIDRKLTWIGIGPHKTDVDGLHGPLVTFDHFLYFGADGPDLACEAPHLAKLMYEKKARVAMSFDALEQADVDHLLSLAEHEPPSPAQSVASRKSEVCRTRQPVGGVRRSTRC